MVACLLLGVGLLLTKAHGLNTSFTAMAVDPRLSQFDQKEMHLTCIPGILCEDGYCYENHYLNANCKKADLPSMSCNNKEEFKVRGTRVAKIGDCTYKECDSYTKMSDVALVNPATSEIMNDRILLKEVGIRGRVKFACGDYLCAIGTVSCNGDSWYKIRYNTFPGEANYACIGLSKSLYVDDKQIKNAHIKAFSLSVYECTSYRMTVSGNHVTIMVQEPASLKICDSKDCVVSKVEEGFHYYTFDRMSMTESKVIIKLTIRKRTYERILNLKQIDHCKLLTSFEKMGTSCQANWQLWLHEVVLVLVGSFIGSLIHMLLKKFDVLSLCRRSGIKRKNSYELVAKAAVAAAATTAGIRILPAADACTIYNYQSVSCSGSVCPSTHEFTLDLGEMYCATSDTALSNHSLSVEHLETIWIPELEHLYYTSNTVVEKRHRSQCHNGLTGACKITENVHSQRIIDYENEFSKAMSGIGFSGIFLNSAGWANGCFSDAYMCIYWTVSLTPSGETFNVLKVMKWVAQTKLRITLDGHSQDVMLSSGTSTIRNGTTVSILHSVISDKSLPRYLLMSQSTVRTSSMVSEKNFPVRELPGNIQCSTESHWSWSFCVSTDDLVSCSLTSDLVDCRLSAYDLSLLPALPYSEGDLFYTTDESHSVIAVDNKPPRVHATVSTDFIQKVSASNLNCLVRVGDIKGCYACARGASVEVISNGGSCMSSVKLAGSVVNLALKNGLNVATFHINRKLNNPRVEVCIGGKCAIHEASGELIRLQPKLSQATSNERFEHREDMESSITAFFSNFGFSHWLSYLAIPLYILIAFVSLTFLKLIIDLVRKVL